MLIVKRTNLRMNDLASVNVMPILCQLTGSLAASTIGFGFNLHKKYSFSDLMIPVYASLALALLIRLSRDALKKHVVVLMQYDTKVGLAAHEGKELHLKAYKITLAFESLYVGLIMGWTLVVLST